MNENDSPATTPKTNPALYLGGSQARELKARGHHLNPIVMVGREGITPTVLESLEAVLTAHELIKARIQEGCPEDKTATAEGLARKSKSKIVQIIGRNILLYRENPAKKAAPAPGPAPKTGKGRRTGRSSSAGRQRAKPTIRSQANAKGAGRPQKRGTATNRTAKGGATKRR